VATTELSLRDWCWRQPLPHRPINDAWQIDVTQYDTNGNATWALTAGNRAQALSPISGVTDSVVAATSGSAARADLLAATTVYDPLHPSQTTDTYGALHPVVLNDNSTVHARAHSATAYDEGAPDTTWRGLPTTTTASAVTTDGIDHDPITTHTGNAAILAGDTTGWDLRQATTSTVQMGANPSGADLITKTRYTRPGRPSKPACPAPPTTAAACPPTPAPPPPRTTPPGPAAPASATPWPGCPAPSAPPSNPAPATRYR
jgi:hypothetical protein